MEAVYLSETSVLPTLQAVLLPERPTSIFHRPENHTSQMTECLCIVPTGKWPATQEWREDL